MPEGLQVFDATGAVKLDITTRLLRLLTVADLTIGTPATVPFTPPAAGTSAVGVSILGGGGSTSLNTQPNISIGSGSVDFTWPSGSGSGTVRAEIFVY